MNQNFHVQGMTCGHCEKAVTQAVQSVDPQAKVTIDRPTGKVEVQTQPAARGDRPRHRRRRLPGRSMRSA